MKMKLFTLLTSALLCSNLSFGKIFRVGYTGLPIAGVDYTPAQAQQAQDEASHGDTIQVYGSAGSMTVNKQLVILGFGYNFDINTNLQAIGTDEPSQINLTLNTGSNGTIVSGVSGGFYVSASANETDGISDITFQRCRGSFYFANYISYGAISNIKIISCVASDISAPYTFPNAKPLSNLQVFNCILNGVTLYGTATTATIVNCVSASAGYVMTLNLNDAGVVVKNCIFYRSNSNNNINTVYENCFFGEAQPSVLPSGNNNRWSQSWAALFNRLGGVNDANGYYGDETFDEDYYVLKAGSPAINGGFNAASAPTDCGIYGGELAYVYKLSGVPAVPAIYKLTAPGPAATSNPYNITISVRSNN